VAADAAGYRRLLDLARARIPGRRCSAVEGAGSYGAGLTALRVLLATRQGPVTARTGAIKASAPSRPHAGGSPASG